MEIIHVDNLAAENNNLTRTITTITTEMATIKKLMGTIQSQIKQLALNGPQGSVHTVTHNNSPGNHPPIQKWIIILVAWTDKKQLTQQSRNSSKLYNRYLGGNGSDNISPTQNQGAFHTMHNTNLELTKQIISVFYRFYLKGIKRRHKKNPRSTIAKHHPTSLRQL